MGEELSWGGVSSMRTHHAEERSFRRRTCAFRRRRIFASRRAHKSFGAKSPRRADNSGHGYHGPDRVASNQFTHNGHFERYGLP